MYSVRIQNGAIWNSFFDIGQLVSEDEYLYMENVYVDLLSKISRRTNFTHFTIEGLENYDGLALSEGQSVSLKELPFVAKAILREQCWCKLVNDSLEFHFGYDYIMYVVVKKKNINIQPILHEYRETLVVDERRSPYL